MFWLFLIAVFIGTALVKLGGILILNQVLKIIVFFSLFVFGALAIYALWRKYRSWKKQRIETNTF